MSITKVVTKQLSPSLTQTTRKVDNFTLRTLVKQ